MAMEEWREAVRHDDEIGVSPSPSPKFANISVPYGCIVPAELDNVLVGGRHIATDPQTQAFMREIPQCWLTGQAAGVAAAHAVAAGGRGRSTSRAPARAARPGRLPAGRVDWCDRRRAAARSEGLDHGGHAAVVSADHDYLNCLL